MLTQTRLLRSGQLNLYSNLENRIPMPKNTSPAAGSQFSLFRLRRFRPFFLTQFAGAFNDNLFKNALLMLLTLSAVPIMGLGTDAVINLAALLFILPFFLFSALAGQIADKYEKSSIIRRIKQLEIVIMAVAAVALLLEWFPGLLALLFLMGTQSAFFGPVKYAIIPQHLENEELVGGNALVSVGTFIAILLGTIVGSIMGANSAGGIWPAMGVVTLAVLGYLASRGIPTAPSAQPTLKIKWDIFRETAAVVRLAREKRSVFLSVLAISWFWFIGAAYLTQIPNFGATTLAAEPSVITLLLVMFVVGIGLGSMLCEKLSGRHVELGIVPIGSLGLSLFGIDLYFAVPAAPLAEPLTWLTQLEHGAYRRVLIDLAAIGAFGGLFIVPLYAFIQQQTPPDRRARVIAALNIINALFMVTSAAVGLLLLGFAGLTIPEFLLLVALANIPVCLYVYSQVPEFALRFVIWMLSHTLYRVRAAGLEAIPDEGPVVLVCNHVSYTDPLIIAGAIKRPVRFVMDEQIFSSSLLGWFFRLARAIPIASRQQRPEVYEQAIEAIDQALGRGEVVCIFPEGRLTRDGEIGQFRKGIETIVERNPVPVVPMALQGLWGSFFSYRGGPALGTLPRRFWSHIGLKASAPLASGDVSAQALEDEVRRLYHSSI